MKKYLVDTNILIDYLRNKNESINFIEESIKTADLFISVITIAELHAGIKNQKEHKIMEKFFSVFKTIDINSSIAEQGGLYRHKYGKSHSVCLADALIAASTSYANAQLITLNKKHFPMLSDIIRPY